MSIGDPSATFEPDWRTRHCAEPAVARLREATGRDLWDELGGCPRNPREAAEVLRKLGVTSFRDAVTAVLGDPINPRLAKRGDIALVDNALGIVRGDLIECIDRMQPIARATCAWKINGG